jgi:hypothetical protein
MSYFELCYYFGLYGLATAATTLLLLAVAAVLLFALEQGKILLNRFARFLDGE